MPRIKDLSRINIYMLRFKQFLIEESQTAQTPDTTSDDYFNELEERYQNFITGSDVQFSPMDILSLQFGKDRTKERDDYIQKRQKYNQDHPEIGTYVALPDLKWLHTKIPVSHATKDEIDERKKSDISGGRTDAWFNPGYESVVGDDGIQRLKINDNGTVNMTPQIKYDDYALTNRPEILSHLGHEFEHFMGSGKVIEDMINSYVNNKELPSFYDVSKKYNIGLSMDELSSRGKKEGLRFPPADPAIATAEDDAKKLYHYNRSEVPSFMHEIKTEILSNTGKMPSADQTDEEIDKMVDDYYHRMLEKSKKNSQEGKPTHFNLSNVRLLQLLKTSEGKSLWRGAAKTPSNNQSSQGTRLT